MGARSERCRDHGLGRRMIQRTAADLIAAFRFTGPLEAAAGLFAFGRLHYGNGLDLFCSG